MEKELLTREQLHHENLDDLISLILSQQEEIRELRKLTDLMSEEIRGLRSARFGRSSEKDLTGEQLSFAEAFNEAEKALEEPCEEPQLEEVTYRRKKRSGKRDEDLSGLPVTVVEHHIPEAELEELFPGGYERFPDEVHRTLSYHPATFEVLEHHVAVYHGKNGIIRRAECPEELLKGSIVTPSLAAGIMNAKYVNAIPLYRLEKEFERQGIPIRRQNMAHWMIRLSERYFSPFLDRMKAQLFTHAVIHADETPVKVSKDGRKAGANSYMWVYRSNEKDAHPVLLYDYRRTRGTDQLKDFLAGYTGTIVSDGYVSYHKMATDFPERIRVSGCWAHARRKFAEIIKSASGSDRKKPKYTLASYAVGQIANIYHLDNQLTNVSPEERKKERDLTIRPITEALFAWAEAHRPEVTKGSSIGKAFDYMLNQKAYLMAFLDDPDIPLDNNCAERAIRPFVIGKKNWHLIDTVYGAEASAMIYSVAETAKANGLKPYEYFKYLLEELPGYLEGTDVCALDELLPWTDNVRTRCQSEPLKESESEND